MTVERCQALGKLYIKKGKYYQETGVSRHIRSPIEGIIDVRGVSGEVSSIRHTRLLRNVRLSENCTSHRCSFFQSAVMSSNA